MERLRSYISDIPRLTTGISVAGLLTLTLSGLLPWPVFGLIAGAHLVVARYLFHKDIPGYLFGFVIGAVFLGEGLRVYLEGRTAVLSALRDMIVILAVARFTLKKTAREIYQIIGISIAECILATVFTVSPVFLIGIVLDAFLIPIALYLLDEQAFQEAAASPPSCRHWTAVFLGIMAVSAVLFFIIPRPSSTIVSLGLAERHRTGFSEDVNLAHPGALEQDRSIVMRILWVSGNPPERFYLAGARLEALGRRGFRKQVASPYGQGERGRITDRLTLYPTGLEARNVFFPYSLQTVVPDQTTTQGANVYWRGVVPPFYDVMVSRRPDVYLDPVNRFFPEALGPVRDLARRIAGEAATPVRVERLRKYLSTRCTYSLGNLGIDPQAPIQSFLERRRGACEHFASAMAAMLRAVGIPARVVTGFLVSEFNTTDRYYIVRASDAHAWVEYWDGVWITVDPTPQAFTPQRRASLIDALRFRWIRWVIEYSLQDQINLARYVKVGLPRLQPAQVDLKIWIGLFCAAALAGFLILRLDRRRTSAYARVLRALEKKGVVLDRSLSHEAHLQQIIAQWPALAPAYADYLKHYLAWRFGGGQADIKPLTDALIAKIRRDISPNWRKKKRIPGGRG